MQDNNAQAREQRSPFPPTRTLFVACVVVALTLALAACGGGSSKPADITIKDLSFTTTASVAAGSTVTIQNNDSFTHTVTADDGKSFDVTVDAGKSASFTAPAAGTYKFHCRIHSTMHGTLTVT